MTPCKVLLVAPAFPTHTFWRLGATCAVVGARHTQPPLGLMTVAALLPSGWTCRLIDRNVGTLTAADLDWADLVATGGMNVQRSDCLAVIALAHRQGKPVVVGGPDITSEPEVYHAADFAVRGEAEGVIADFVAAWNAGRRCGSFVAPTSSVDITRSPVPRFDLARRGAYLHYGVQYSRGCPFTCEFCDIIELYGRVPRVKTVKQLLDELEVLYRSGVRGHLDFVDDNFIGNKKAVKDLLPALVAWQRARGYPFWFSTEASLNLADDGGLLALMQQANFAAIFVGIESPDAATLAATRKKQNTRRRIADSVRRIQQAGLLVLGGFIVGFDTETGDVASAMIDCIAEAAIPVCMAGLLVAAPNTQLHRRLQREGRLFSVDWDWDIDHCTRGLNFETLRPRRDVLADYRRILEAIYSPTAYFARVRDAVARSTCWPTHGEAPETSQRWRLLGVPDRDWRRLSRLLMGALRAGPATFLEVIRLLIWAARTNPGRLHLCAVLASFYLHLGPFARAAAAAVAGEIAAIDRGDWRSPPLATAMGAESAPVIRQRAAGLTARPRDVATPGP